MSRSLRAGLIAAAVATTAIAMPVAAATYVGTLTGTITSGMAAYTYLSTFSGYNLNLTGTPITLIFTSDVEYNYTDPQSGIFYAKYVDNNIRFYTTASYPFANAVAASSTSMLPYPSYSADYVGDEHNATVTSSGEVPSCCADIEPDVVFSFAGAQPTTGPLSGSGTISDYYYNPVGEYDTLYVTFTLTNGVVTGPASGTPEPASWALMILGFGAVGGMARRQRVRMRYAGASFAR